MDSFNTVDTTITKDEIYVSYCFYLNKSIEYLIFIII